MIFLNETELKSRKFSKYFLLDKIYKQNNCKILQIFQMHQMQSSQQKMIQIYLRTFDKKARLCSIKSLTNKSTISNLIERRIKYQKSKIIVFYKGKLIIANHLSKQSTSSDQLIYLQDKQILHVLSIQNIIKTNININIKQIFNFKQIKQFRQFKISYNPNKNLEEFCQKQVKNLVYQNQDKTSKVKIGSIIQLIGQPVFIYTGRVLKLNQSFIEQYVQNQSEILCLFPNIISKEDVFKQINTQDFQSVQNNFHKLTNEKQEQNQYNHQQIQNKQLSNFQTQSQKPFSPATKQLQTTKQTKVQQLSKNKSQIVQLQSQVKINLPLTQNLVLIGSSIKNNNKNEINSDNNQSNDLQIDQNKLPNQQIFQSKVQQNNIILSQQNIVQIKQIKSDKNNQSVNNNSQQQTIKQKASNLLQNKLQTQQHYFLQTQNQINQTPLSQVFQQKQNKTLLQQSFQNHQSTNQLQQQNIQVQPTNNQNFNINQNQLNKKSVQSSQTPQIKNEESNQLGFFIKKLQIPIQTMDSDKFQQLKNQRSFSENHKFQQSHGEDLLQKQQQQIEQQLWKKTQDNFSQDLQQYQKQMRSESNCSNEQIEPQGFVPQIKFVEGDLLYTAQIDFKKKVPLMDLLAYQYHDLLCKNLQQFVEEFGNICINYQGDNQFIKI